MKLAPSRRLVGEPQSPRVPFPSGSLRKCRRSRAPLPGVGLGLRTGTATRRRHPARSCSGWAGEASWGRSKDRCTGTGKESQEHRGVLTVTGAQGK